MPSNLLYTDKIEFIAIDTKTPEDAFMGLEEYYYEQEELFEYLKDFEENEKNVLMGLITRREAAQLSGITYDAFRKKLQRKVEKFKKRTDLMEKCLKLRRKVSQPVL